MSISDFSPCQCPSGPTPGSCQGWVSGSWSEIQPMRTDSSLLSSAVTLLTHRYHESICIDQNIRMINTHIHPVFVTLLSQLNLDTSWNRKDSSSTLPTGFSFHLVLPLQSSTRTAVSFSEALLEFVFMVKHGFQDSPICWGFPWKIL